MQQSPDAAFVAVLDPGDEAIAELTNLARRLGLTRRSWYRAPSCTGDPRLQYAYRFDPDVWLDGRARDNWSLVPFSGGPGRYPGQNLVLLVTSTLLAVLLPDHQYTLTSRPAPSPDRPLPASLDHFRLRFAVHRTDRRREAPR